MNAGSAPTVTLAGDQLVVIDDRTNEPRPLNRTVTLDDRGWLNCEGRRYATVVDIIISHLADTS